MRPLILTLTLVVAAAPGGRAQQATFPARVDIVTVDAVVFDRQGNPVEGLTRDDFVVREDGRPQDIAAFEAVSLLDSPAAAAPRSRVSTNDEAADAAARWFFIVFDDTHVTPLGTDRARQTIELFIDQALRPGDRVMIAPASGGSNWIGELPRDRENLVAYVQRLQGERRVESGAGRIWDYEAMGIALGRDRQAEAQVLRRYFESGLVPEAQLSNDPEIQGNFGNAAPGGAVAPGAQAVRIKARQVYAEARSGLQVTLGTLARMAEALAGARGRKTLLLVSEGFIMDQTLEAFRSLLAAARNANVAVHYVDVRTAGARDGQAGLPGGNAEIRGGIENADTLAAALMAREEEGARAIAADTGGRVITGTDLLPALRRVATEGRAYYLLGYSPSNNRREGRFRKIELTVRNRPDVTVRARGGYYEPSAERGTPQPDPDTLNPDVRAGLDSPFGAPGIPLRLTSYALGPQIGGRVQMLLVADADPTPLRLQPRAGRYSTTLETYVLVHDRSRDSLERNERVVELDLPPDAYAQVTRTGIPLQREFALEPGNYQATLLVRDRATGVIGSVRHEFEVPQPREFRITTPIVTDIVQPPAAPGQPPAPVPIARRAFKAGTRIAAGFEIYGAAAAGPTGPQVSVAYSLRRADGAAIAGAAPQALRPNAQGRFAVTIGISLPADAAGEHQLHVTVRDETAVRVVEHVEPITIGP